MDLSPRVLRYFVAVAEERHFSRAAQRLHMSQPPLSYAIRQLEESLGATLLHRTSRQVSLTAAGEALYVEALSLLKRSDDVRTLIAGIESGKVGRLRIGFVGSMVYRGLPNALTTLRHIQPGVEHVLTELNSRDQLEALQRDELDLAFIHANPAPDGVTAVDIVAEQFVVCIPATHRLADADEIALQDLAADEFVLFARDASPRYYETVLSLCAHAGFTPAIRHEVRHWLTVASLVSQGLGVAIVPSCLARSGLTGCRFIAFPHTDKSVCQLAWRHARTAPLIQASVEEILGYYREQNAEGE